MWKAYLVIFLLLAGCVTTQPFHETVTLDRVEVHVVSDRTLFDWSGAQDNTLGYAYPTNKIFFLGRRQVDGTIVPDFYWVAGHELQHLMNWQNPVFANPDN